MSFPFSKAFLSTYYADDNTKYKGLRLYYVYIDNRLLGQYFRHGREQFFAFQDQKIKILSTERWFKEPEYSIVNERDGQTIGRFIVPYPYNDSFYHYPEVPYTNPYLKIILFDAEYEFRREKTDTQYWLFDMKTWGHYGFAIYDKQNTCMVSYSFKIENPYLDGSVSAYNGLEGNIRAEESNLLLLFAGFFLLERFFDDHDGSG